MVFTVSIYDLFTYATPGSLQLAFFAYLMERLNLVDLSVVRSWPGLLVVAGVAIGSYLLGHVTYVLAGAVERLNPFRSYSRWAPWEVVSSRLPEGGPALPRVDYHLLLAANELHDMDVSAEIRRLRAVGLTLRNSNVPLVFAFIAACVELAVGSNRLGALICVVALPIVVISLRQQSEVFRRWAAVKTYEINYWIRVKEDRQRTES